MSIRDAIVQSTQSVLSIYLAPELVERLSEEIMVQAMPDIQEALISCIGVDMSKPFKSAVGKGTGKAAKAKATAKPKKAKGKEAVVNNDGDGDDDDMDVPMSASQDDSREMLPA